jgi:hypothetical protein
MTCLRGQATVEFMLSFLAAIAFFTVLLAAISAADSAAKGRAGEVAENARMEGFLGLAEEYSNSGIAMAGEADVSYRIENGEIRSDYMNRTIVVRGIVDAGKTAGEPS